MNKIFNKENKAFVLSGSCAIITILKSKLKKGAKVVIPNNVCTRVLESVVLSGMIPIIVGPKNGLVLQNEDIEIIKKNTKFDAIIIVHNYGIESDVKKIRLNNLNTIIIEDCAQYWSNDNNIGLFSNYVMTSVDSNKPLNGNHYGIILFDKEEVFLDKGIKTRYDNSLSLPFALTNEPTDKELNNIIEMASKNNFKINKYIKKLNHLLSNYRDIIYPNKKCNNLKYPIIFKSTIHYNKFKKIADKQRFSYSEPHEKMLEELPMLKNIKYYFYECGEKYMRNQIYIKVNNLSDKYIKILDNILGEVFYDNN